MNLLLSFFLCTTSLFSPGSTSGGQGSVSYFYDTMCPSGYTEATYLRDRTIVGQGLIPYLNESYVNDSTFNYTIESNNTPPFFVPLFSRKYPLLPCKKTMPAPAITNNTDTRAHFVTLNATYQTEISLLSASINETIFWQQTHFDLLNETLSYFTMNISHGLSRLNSTYHEILADLWEEWEKSKPVSHLLALFEQLHNQKEAYSTSLQKRIKLLNETTNQQTSILNSQMQTLAANVQASFTLSKEYKKLKEDLSDDEIIWTSSLSGFALGLLCCGFICCCGKQCSRKSGLNSVPNNRIYYPDGSDNDSEILAANL